MNKRLIARVATRIVLAFSLLLPVLVPAQAPVSRREADDYTFARRLYDQGDYDLAERQLRD
ncbi:MAG TPA: hypothetical protein ENN56_04385, partial [Firmicutes bacterium]|nr:hypothetical protein [Bacillota bacterium]